MLKLPSGMPLESAAPLLCAGITTYSPLRHWKVGKGQKIAIVGLGGLGHMGVKFAASLGAEVTVLSTSRRRVRQHTPWRERLPRHHRSRSGGQGRQSF